MHRHKSIYIGQSVRVRDLTGAVHRGEVYRLDDILAILTERRGAWEPSRVPAIEAAYRAGKRLPPVKISCDRAGRCVVSDGEHRIAVAERLGVETIAARIIDRRTGRRIGLDEVRRQAWATGNP